jgi:hypothetical protein
MSERKKAWRRSVIRVTPALTISTPCGTLIATQ